MCCVHYIGVDGINVKTEPGDISITDCPHDNLPSMYHFNFSCVV